MPDAARERHAGAASAGGRRQAIWPYSLLGPLPEPTESDGPDPYGNPDPEWLRIDWRERLRTVEVGRTPVNYVEMGGGPDLLLVHGLAGCWQNWLETIPHFARTHRVLALDLPGFGDSPLPPWEVSIPNYGRLLHDFCEATGARPAALVGNSMGGFVSAEAAATDADRFGKLVLVSAAGVSHGRMRREPAEAVARLAVAATPLALRYRDLALRRRSLRHRAFGNVFYKPTELRVELLWETLHGALDAPGFLPAIGGLVGHDVLDRLEEVELPTLIVWGRNDRIVPPGDAFGYAERLRNSRVEILDRCGHCPQLERPVRFNRLLDRFLAA